ncbi:MAG: ribonuclease HI [Campylobacter sp.]|nr:ribonuclease HI [Campylobacter sp.]
MKSICLFSDGSCLGNPGAGGWAYILRFGKHEKKTSGGSENTTNNKMELTAVIEALKVLKEPCKIDLYTDSSYVANAINSWLDGWIKKDFKNIKNPELWKEYLEVANPHQIKAWWVKAHNGHPENEECDDMAKAEALKIKFKG